ncbi:CPBP family intramembrane metalloprotease [Romboutsia sedimentorum]|uniref:CPBP family intramembrane metalloprotease n=1 Tax=Romboutsia sedimentorum TaxID=1368474 RepID=A0ABT7E8J2_9FIRM|nr:CPBP family intramembrane glutamic endopeptidase [Romboutsia sedimentorum]MDK2562403.1 CPBP family intramembrane metalloprotease [Romboutsia sedimentorum]
MCTNVKVIKKEVSTFLLINFGLIAFISIFMFISTTKPYSADLVGSFGGLFMYIPAFSAIVVLKKISNYSFPPSVDKFFNVFAIATLVRIFVSILQVFFIGNITISSIIDMAISCYLICVLFKDKFDFEILNLSLNKNFKKVLFVVLLFSIISIVRSIPAFLSVEDNSINIIGGIFTILTSLLANIFFGFTLFFGEEFGWRYFLQPRLQKLYGKRCGVIILGLIWGIWHLPLCMTLYSPKTPIYCIVFHLAFCTTLGVFLGYAYMKSENLWAPILIHLVNNSISIISNSGSYESEFTLQTLLVGILINAIFFLPFLFTKEYKKADETASLDI